MAGPKIPVRIISYYLARELPRTIKSFCSLSMLATWVAQI
jgi:hypothetical protein